MTPTHTVNNSSQGTMENMPRNAQRVGHDAGLREGGGRNSERYELS